MQTFKHAIVSELSLEGLETNLFQGTRRRPWEGEDAIRTTLRVREGDRVHPLRLHSIKEMREEGVVLGKGATG